MYFYDILGTIGNVAAIVLLSRPHMKNCFFNQLLLLLVTFDLIYIFTMIAEALMMLIPNNILVFLPIILLPLNNISMAGKKIYQLFT